MKLFRYKITIAEIKFHAEIAHIEISEKKCDFDCTQNKIK